MHDNRPSYIEEWPLVYNRTANDTDPAFRVCYQGTSTVHTAAFAAGILTLTNDAGATTYNTLTTYTTYTLLVAAVESANTGFFLSPDTVLMADDLQTGGATAYLLDVASVTVGADGVSLFWDTSDVKRMRVTLGMAAVKNLDGSVFPAAAKFDSRTLPILPRDPTFGTGYSSFGFPSNFSAVDHNANLRGFTAAVTGATWTAKVYKASRYVDGDSQSYAGAATTVEKVFGPDELGGSFGIITGPGERIIVEIAASTFTSGYLNVIGGSGQFH